MRSILRKWLGPVLGTPRALRRALMGRFDARVVRLVSTTIEERMLPTVLGAFDDIEARFERIERLMVRLDRSTSALPTMVEDVDVVLDGLTREIFRLRAQVERLRPEDRVGLSILSEPEPEPGERSRVG
jgi:hypothetical protein